MKNNQKRQYKKKNWNYNLNELNWIKIQIYTLKYTVSELTCITVLQLSYYMYIYIIY